MTVCGIYFVYIYRYLPYIHMLECTRKILRTRLKKDMVVLEKKTSMCEQNETMDVPDLEMVINKASPKKENCMSDDT